MSTRSFALRDSTTMLRRDIRHSLRSVTMSVTGLMVPLIMLVLFNYLYGGAIGAGLGGRTLGGSYINYLAPAILAMTVASGCEVTALTLVTDMNEGIITRFRTLPISRAAVLNGQVMGSLLRTMLSVILVLAVALLMGFRPTADPLAWAAALGLIALFTFGISWMGMVFGLVGKTPAGANSLSLIFTLLAFTSSAFVSPDSMAGWVRAFAQYQPFTPVIDTLRGLLLGTPLTGETEILAVAWCLALALIGFLLARAVYSRDPVR